MIYARPLADEANATWEGSAVMSGKRPLVLQNGVPSEAPDTDFIQLADVAVSGNFVDLSGRSSVVTLGVETEVAGVMLSIVTELPATPIPGVVYIVTG